MIPESLDDGFTVEPVEGIFCRPMLWESRREWKRIASEDPEAAWHFIRASYVTHVNSVVLEDHKIAVIQAVCGYTSAQESEDFQGLHDSVYLHYVNPGLSTLDCQTCRTYFTDNLTGELYIAADGLPKYLPKNAKALCETSQCAKVHWSDPIGLSNGRWAKTWRHYWLFRDSPKMMTDPIFRRNAALIRWIVDYGRDRRFDPYIGRSSHGGAANVPAEGTDRPVHNRTCSSGGGCPGGSCGTGCSSI
jgi:hypothetical protein